MAAFADAASAFLCFEPVGKKKKEKQ